MASSCIVEFSENSHQQKVSNMSRQLRENIKKQKKIRGVVRLISIKRMLETKGFYSCDRTHFPLV